MDRKVLKQRDKFVATWKRKTKLFKKQFARRNRKPNLPIDFVV